MSNAAREVRKHTAQHDLFNRLHSIAADQAFVDKVAQHYDRRYPVVPNQRCGNWYCGPSSSKLYAYFKSTDGHTSNWNFNLRRSNLPLVDQIARFGGIILVDSTRRGKRMPDALSKTVPIWCTVINRAIASKYGTDLDGTLFLPPSIVSASEKSQIEALLPSWVDSLLRSSLSLPNLDKPLRPFFLHPSSSLPSLSRDPPFYPIICLSASRWVGSNSDDIPTFTRLGTQTVGFEYVPGAGDDDELWARGLTTKVFHEQRERLLRVPRDELREVVDELVSGALSGSLDQLALDTTAQRPWRQPTLIGFPESGSRLALELGDSIGAASVWDHAQVETATTYVLQLDKPPKDLPALAPLDSTESAWLLVLPNPRADGKSYVETLSEVLPDIGSTMAKQPAILAPGSQEHLTAALSHHSDPAISKPFKSTWTPNQEDLVSARKVIIPFVIALACHLDAEEGGSVDKDNISRYLQRLVSLWPDGNPPRVALRRINEVLMSSR